jgi:hypothetical protein
MKRIEETCLGERPCSHLFLDQKIHLGLTAEGGFDTVYQTMFSRNNGKMYNDKNNETRDGQI